jgi:DNA-binding NarL/FixJ family response regulator
MAVSVLLVEDEPTVRDHLARAIRGRAELELVGAEATFADGRRRLTELRPAVLLTDLGLPDGNGIDLIRQAAATGSTLPLVVTVFGDEEHVVEAIRAGALGYLLKSDDELEASEAVLQVIAGGSPISPSIARYLLDSVRGVTPATTPDAPALSERELEILRYIVKGFTYAEIAGLLERSASTVATHVRRIYKKLAVHSRSEATYEALQMGLVRHDE